MSSSVYFAKLFDVSIGRRVDLVLHIAHRPGSDTILSVSHSYVKFIFIGERARKRLPGRRSNSDFGLRILGIEHALFELQPHISRGYSREIAGQNDTMSIFPAH